MIASHIAVDDYFTFAPCRSHQIRLDRILTSPPAPSLPPPHPSLCCSFQCLNGVSKRLRFKRKCFNIVVAVIKIPPASLQPVSR